VDQEEPSKQAAQGAGALQALEAKAGKVASPGWPVRQEPAAARPGQVPAAAASVARLEQAA